MPCISSIYSTQNPRRERLATQHNFDNMSLPAGTPDNFRDTAAIELVERIKDLTIERSTIVQIDGHDKYLTTMLQALYPECVVYHTDNIRERSKSAADASIDSDTSSAISDDLSLPFESDCADLIVSNLDFSFYQPQALINECLRILSDDGVLIFSAFAPDAFRQLRSACSHLQSLAFKSEFVDMHNVGDMLAVAGFTNPVVDTDRSEYFYPDIESLVEQLFDFGFATDLIEPATLLRKRDVQDALMNHYPDEQGALTGLKLSLEIFFGIAWKRTSGRTSTAVSFDAD